MPRAGRRSRAAPVRRRAGRRPSRAGPRPGARARRTAHSRGPCAAASTGACGLADASNVRPGASARSPTSATARCQGAPLACSMRAATPSKAMVEYRETVPAAKSRPGASNNAAQTGSVHRRLDDARGVAHEVAQSHDIVAPGAELGDRRAQRGVGCQSALFDEAQRGEPDDRLRDREQRVVVVDGHRPPGRSAERVERDDALGVRDAEHGGGQQSVVDVAAGPVEGVVEVRHRVLFSRVCWSSSSKPSARQVRSTTLRGSSPRDIRSI